jgi:gentisate 1,2-dioxygenase
MIEGERMEWHKGDLFAIPPWTWHVHENASRDDTILFSIDDWPAMKSLGFYRAEGEAAS